MTDTAAHPSGMTTAERRLPFLIVDYLRRMPATVANVASHFGMQTADAEDALWSLKQQGRAHRNGPSNWEASDDE